MAVLELAVFSIKSPYSVDTPELKSSLQNVLRVLNKATGFTFDLYQQLEDLSVLYLLGSWSSVEVHNEFIASPENKALLEDLKDSIKVDLFFHAEIDKSSLPLNAPCIAIGRHFIKADKKEEFSAVWNANSHHLAEFTKPYPLVGGWRIDGIDDGLSGEWVQFTGFQSVENHHEFARTEAFQEYGKIREFLAGFEVKHAKALGW